jgi:hypothetical protein
MTCTAEVCRKEPPLAEILDEPIVAALMQSDQVDRHWLEQLLIDIGQSRSEA